MGLPKQIYQNYVWVAHHLHIPPLINAHAVLVSEGAVSVSNLRQLQPRKRHGQCLLKEFAHCVDLSCFCSSRRSSNSPTNICTFLCRKMLPVCHTQVWPFITHSDPDIRREGCLHFKQEKVLSTLTGLCKNMFIVKGFSEDNVPKIHWTTIYIYIYIYIYLQCLGGIPEFLEYTISQCFSPIYPEWSLQFLEPPISTLDKPRVPAQGGAHGGHRAWWPKWHASFAILRSCN